MRMVIKMNPKTKTIEQELLEKVWSNMFGTLLYYCGNSPSGENISEAFKKTITFLPVIAIENRICRLMRKHFRKPKKWFKKQEDDFDFEDF